MPRPIHVMAVDADADLKGAWTVEAVNAPETERAERYAQCKPANVYY